jgi:tetratricopeptide (TPR) repeat protein
VKPKLEKVEAVVAEAAAATASVAEVAATAPAEPQATPEVTVAAKAVAPARTGVSVRTLLAAGTGVLAASVLLAFFVATAPEREASRRLASAEQAMQAGDPALAQQRITEFYEKGMESRTKADQIAISSGIELARMRLQEGEFGQVLDIEHKVSRYAGPSAELLRLRLQAEQRETNEFTLKRAGSLTDYGYDLRGGDYGKSLPEINDTTDRIVAEFRIATEKYGDDVALRLNYGQFLLSLDRWEDAKKQFTIARDLDKNNGLALLGLGMVEFGQAKFDEALGFFKEMIRVEPKSPAGPLNAAICLERLERPDEAKPYWEQALGLLDEDNPLKTKINEQIFKNAGNDTEA